MSDSFNIDEFFTDSASDGKKAEAEKPVDVVVTDSKKEASVTSVSVAEEINDTLMVEKKGGDDHALVKAGPRLGVMIPEDLKGHPAFVEGTLGNVVNRFPIERMKFDSKRKIRFSIIAEDLLVVRTHYIDGLGHVYSTEGLQKRLGIPNPRYVFPVVEYECNREGKIVGPGFDVRFGMFGKDQYEALLNAKEAGDLLDMDFLVSCTDDKYQKIAITPIPRASWKKSKEFMKVVLERAAETWKYTPMVVASVKTDKEALEAYEKAEAKREGGHSERRNDREERAPKESSEGFDLSEFMK